MNSFRSCPCKNPYIPAKTVTKVIVVKRYSTVVCPDFLNSHLDFSCLDIFRSVTATPGLVNTRTLKMH